MITPALKLKYRNPNRRKRPTAKNTIDPEGGTWVYQYGSQIPSRPRSGNSHGPTPKHPKGGIRPRKKAYGPF